MTPLIELEEVPILYFPLSIRRDWGMWFFSLPPQETAAPFFQTIRTV